MCIIAEFVIFFLSFLQPFAEFLSLMVRPSSYNMKRRLYFRTGKIKGCKHPGSSRKTEITEMPLFYCSFDSLVNFFFV